MCEKLFFIPTCKAGTIRLNAENNLSGYMPKDGVLGNISSMIRHIINKFICVLACGEKIEC